MNHSKISVYANILPSTSIIGTLLLDLAARFLWTRAREYIWLIHLLTMVYTCILHQSDYWWIRR